MKKVVAPESGRLDKVLSLALNKSRNQISHLIERGSVKVDGATIKKVSFKVSLGQEIEYRFLEAKKSLERGSVDFDVETLYEDDEILVINKPSNLVVHPAPSVKEVTLVDWLMQKGISLSTIYGKERFGIVHRIDKDTTGVLVVAKTNEAHIKLSEELKSKKMGRFYIAIINYPLKESLTVSKPIARNPKNRLKMGVVAGGKDAKTDFLKIAQSRELEIVGARLHTGRTHQIRVHLSSLNRYILGDRLYGVEKNSKVERIFLHAFELYLTHPKSGKKLRVQAPLFEDMEQFIVEHFDRRVLDEEIFKRDFYNSFNELFGSI